MCYCFWYKKTNKFYSVYLIWSAIFGLYRPESKWTKLIFRLVQTHELEQPLKSIELFSAETLDFSALDRHCVRLLNHWRV